VSAGPPATRCAREPAAPCPPPHPAAVARPARRPRTCAAAFVQRGGSPAGSASSMQSAAGCPCGSPHTPRHWNRRPDSPRSRTSPDPPHRREFRCAAAGPGRRHQRRRRWKSEHRRAPAETFRLRTGPMRGWPSLPRHSLQYRKTGQGMQQRALAPSATRTPKNETRAIPQPAVKVSPRIGVGDDDMAVKIAQNVARRDFANAGACKPCVR